MRLVDGWLFLLLVAPAHGDHGDYDHNAHCPLSNCYRGSVGDPHLIFANGGKADFRGKNGTIYAFLSAPKLQVNVLTEARTFRRVHSARRRQLVHGSFVTRAFIRILTTVNGKETLVRIAILAEQYDSFRDYRTDELPSFFVDTPQARYYNKTRIELPSVGVYQMGMGRTFIRGNGWQFTVHRRRQMKPVVEQPPETQGGGGGDYVGPSGGWTRLHWFLDTKFDVLESLVDKPELAALLVSRLTPVVKIGSSPSTPVQGAPLPGVPSQVPQGMVIEGPN